MSTEVTIEITEQDGTSYRWQVTDFDEVGLSDLLTEIVHRIGEPNTTRV